LYQNREETDSHPRKNNDKYLKLNNTFGKDLLDKTVDITHMHLDVIIYKYMYVYSGTIKISDLFSELLE